MFIYFLFHLLIYAGLRLQFLIWNWAALKALSAGDLAWAFWNGLRFDISVLSVTLGLFFVGSLWGHQFRLWQKLWFWFWALLNAVLIVLNFADSELINFTARRFTKSSLFLWQEAHASNLILPYLGMAALTVLYLTFYFYVGLRLHRRQRTPFSLWGRAVLTVGLILAVVIGVRGGLQTKPLTFVDAKIFDHSLANNLVLNSSFTLFKSLGKSSFQRAHFYERDEMLSWLNRQDLPSDFVPLKSDQPLNVIYVFLESFSDEYTHLKNPEFTPFLNQLRTKSIDFTKAYANGRRSIEGVAALLSGIPALMEEPFINSEFSANQMIGLGTLLASQNYHTSFFHGAQNGSMHFDQFTKSVGLAHYYGKKDYPKSGDDDGTWGIYDEPFLQWMCDQLSGFPQPFFSAVFTLTSHQPFKVPAGLERQFPEGELPILKTVAYTDSAFEKFMKCAEQQSWYQNTLFVITADHTGPALKADADFESRFRIPLLFYSPRTEVLKSLSSNQVAQHIDVLPTVLETLGIEQKNKNYLARSLWQKGPKVVALYADGQYQLVGDVQDATKQLRAIQQYFSEGLYDNRLYYPVK